MISTILRRTSEAVHIRYWCRGFLPLSFKKGRLTVDFIAAEGDVTGRYPGHVGRAVFDRLRVIPDMPDWDRCLIMDQDMGVYCDLAPYFREDFEGNLLMGRLFGAGNTLGLQMKQRGGLPESHAHCEDYPYFFMGPMMNLKLMREEGLWEKFLEAHEAIGQDEQISLTAACGGRVKGVDKKYNLVPQWDYLEEASKRVDESAEREVMDRDIRWRNGVPEGVIHWTGWQKPWQKGSKVWRADLWESEKTSWEQLRLGLWEKPRAIDIEPENGFGVRALARRGWGLNVFSERFSLPQEKRPKIDGRDVPYPDVSLHGAHATDFQAALMVPERTVEMVRFGPDATPSDWLTGLEALPEYLVVRGPTEMKEVRRLRGLGYGGEVRYGSTAWPTGGPAPRVLDYRVDMPALAVGQGEDLYLKRTGSVVPFSDEEPAGVMEHINGNTETPVDEPAAPVEWPWRISESLEAYLLQQSEVPATVLELGSGHGTSVLVAAFPEARILSLEHHAPWYGDCLQRIRPSAGLSLRHAPLDGGLPWYDCREIELVPVDLLLVNAPSGVQAKSIREGAVALRRYVKDGGRIILGGMSDTKERQTLTRWLNTGGLVMEEDGESYVVLRAEGPAYFRPAFPKEITSLSELAEKVYVISLPAREDRREELRTNWAPFGLEFEVVDGVRPASSDIRWDEMKGMEAYGKAEHLRGGYVHGAVGCKRAGINALKRFLESGAETALICQDDCLWRPDALETIKAAFKELPSDWEMVYFSSAKREKNQPYSPFLIRLGGARLCTAILWKRATAERLLPELEACDCEWDLFMQRSHGRSFTYCVVPMPAYQAKSKSDIVGGVVQPPNQ